VQRLAALCQTTAGAQIARDLLPSSDYRDVLRRQRLTAEALRLTEMKPNLSLAETRDVRSLVSQASLGHVLQPAELLEVRTTLALSRTIRDTITRLRVHLPYLAEISDRIDDFSDLTSAIGGAVNSAGDIVDTASPVLSQLRHDARQAHDRLYRKVQQVLNSSGARGAIQDPIVTLRDGRYVIPVKAELRSQVPGIVHDVSSSGATVFLEPLEIVDIGNAWREMIAEEEREIQRILRELSDQVGRRSDDIVAAIDALAVIDLSLAKARLAHTMGGVELPHVRTDAYPIDGPDQPWLLDQPDEVHLINARHPLLTRGNLPADKQVVPISVFLGQDEHGFSSLLITGPNTGGKTVALKTVGLLALMAQAGLPLPADRGSRIPVFDAVYADIGDEQSIEQSLSTFSSHVGNIISILGAATPRSLVLLDELAAGTDPTEGAALAKAILSHLLATGCLTVATTHHGELKAFAHVTDGITNGSVEFDRETLAPTYRVHIGLPGMSNALTIAQRLGMPEDILDEARDSIDPDRIAVESLITDLHTQREAAESARTAQETAAQEAERARERVTKELRSLEAHRDRLVERTRKEMEEELSQARLRLRETLKALRDAERLSVFERAQAVDAAQKQVEEVEKQTKKVTRRRRARRPSPLPAIEPGDRVYLHDLPLPGEALSEPDDNDEIEVRLGALRSRVNLKQIERVEKGEAIPETAAPAASESAAYQPVREIDLRGMTVDEALLQVDQRLDEAFRAGLPELRIVHGKGTGTLRRAIRELLSKHALVSSHDTPPHHEGGDGVTVVEIAN
jgi:DNA mismatch repair protein MutS2